MKKLNILSIVSIIQQKKPSSNLFSPDRQKKTISFDNQSIHVKPTVKLPINMMPSSTRTIPSQYMSPPSSCKHSNSQQIQFTEPSQGKQLSSTQRRLTQNQFSSQLKNILSGKRLSKQSPDITTNSNSQAKGISQNGQKNLKTSPDSKLTLDLAKSLASKQNHSNASDRLLRIEQTRQKIITLQQQIAGNIQTRGHKRNTQFFQEEVTKQELPLSSKLVLKQYADELTNYEKAEILDYELIYYLGSFNVKQEPHGDSQTNYGFDNSNGDYRFQKKDHIAYRYELVDKLGHGSFGYVFKVIDHKYHQEVALKVIKNKDKFYNQALIEIDILKAVNKADHSSCLVKMFGYFVFRNHICMVFELLSYNLYEFIAMNEFTGFNLELIRRFAIQILQGLLYLKNSGIIHCDLKPENILLKDMNKSGLKIIDFGSSCYQTHQMYTYIQVYIILFKSRFYRAPEIIFGVPYSTQIDMWSFGCIIIELYTGCSIFQSKSEKELLFSQVKILGMPEKEYLRTCPRRDKFFDAQYQLIHRVKDAEQLLQIKTLEELLSDAPESFADFVTQALKWQPNQRLTPEAGLVHPWILEGLPSQIKKQHISQMKGFKSFKQNLFNSVELQQGQGGEQY